MSNNTNIVISKALMLQIKNIAEECNKNNLTVDNGMVEIQVNSKSDT